MGKVSLFIDGVQVQAEQGMSVLEAALSAGIYIPHLCSHPDLPATGGCKMCVVEIDGEVAAMSSCVTEVQEGMKVRTKSEKLTQLRKIALEFIMAGATGVSLGTANFVDPYTPLKVIDFINDYCDRHGMKSVSELTGSLIN